MVVPEDAFLKTPMYNQLLIYKKYTKLIRIQISKKERVAENILRIYETSNPEMYYTYELLGDYYHALGNKPKAVNYWKKALSKKIPKFDERTRVQNKLTKNL